MSEKTFFMTLNTHDSQIRFSLARKSHALQLECQYMYECSF